MKIKKVLSIALALILAIGMLAGCGGNGGSEIEQADISAFVETDEKLELSWLSYTTLSGCTEGTAPELLIEDKFNVEMKPIFAEGSKYTDKKNALLQAGDIPDLIYELDPMHVFADARDEYLLEIPYAAIQKYAPSIFADLNEKAPAVWAYSYYEGANYGLPNMNHSHVTPKLSIYRGDWLEKLGLEVPETIPELHDVLYAFTHNDPDGNGKDDTWGYAPYSSSHYQWFFAEMFGAYGVLPFDWQEVDGKIVYGGLREECETVLATLADWYKEGLIYPAFVEDATGSKLLQTGKVGYAPEADYSDPQLETSSLNTLKTNFPDGYYSYGKLIKGPEGLAGARSWGYPCHVVSFGNKDESSPVKATRILQMLETMFTDDALRIEISAGKEGEQWVHEEDRFFVATPDYTEGAQKRQAGYDWVLSGPGFWAPVITSDELFASTRATGYKNWLETYGDPATVLTDAFYKIDIVPSAPTYVVDLHNNEMALMAKIIKGEIAADQYIEEFTKIWEGTGGPQLLAEAETQKDVVDEIYAKIGLNK